jgi:hypothetical protein
MDDALLPLAEAKIPLTELEMQTPGPENRHSVLARFSQLASLTIAGTDHRAPHTALPALPSSLVFLALGRQPIGEGFDCSPLQACTRLTQLRLSLLANTVAFPVLGALERRPALHTLEMDWAVDLLPKLGLQRSEPAQDEVRVPNHLHDFFVRVCVWWLLACSRSADYFLSASPLGNVSRSRVRCPVQSGAQGVVSGAAGAGRSSLAARLASESERLVLGEQSFVACCRVVSSHCSCLGEVVLVVPACTLTILLFTGRKAGVAR